MMIHHDWGILLSDYLNSNGFQDIIQKVNQEYKTHVCYPKKEDIFKAFELTSYQNTKVLLLGQDPYHQENQAMGLSFSLREGVPLTPSLKNIFTELSTDLQIHSPQSGDLSKWAKQGVLLLNAILTVRQGKPLSHQFIGWETFTDQIIALLNKKETPVCFILWGQFAKQKRHLITNPIHLVLTSPHPSPLSSYRGFFGSKPFSKINQFLIRENQDPIDFQL